MRFTPTKADLTFLLQTPPLGDLPPLNFGARQVCFTPNGLPDDGGKLTLGPDLTVQGDTYTLTLKGSNSPNGSAPATSTAVTSLNLDCRWGFKSLTLAGEVTLRNDLIRPVAGSGAVKATFAASVSSFQDILLEARVDPFAFLADPDWAFTLQNVSLDLSSSRNPTSMTLTAAEQPGSTPADNTAWTGIYAERVSLSVPSVLTGQTAPTRGTFEGLKIGFQTGVSFRAVVAPVLNLQTGRLGGWQFSIDTLRLTVENNQFGTPVMAGRLRFPLFDEPFRYEARYGPTSAGTPDRTDPTRSLQIGVNVSNAAVAIAQLKSQVRLVEGSRIGVVFRRTGGNITPELSAVFNGQWTVEDVTRDISLPNLAFTDLTYNTTRGFDVSRFTSALASALPSSQITPSSSVSPTNQTPAVAPQRDVCGPKVSDFSLEISQITPLFEGRFEDVSAWVGLQMNVDVKLLGGCAEGGQNTDSWSFGAGGTFSLTGRVSLQNGNPHFSEPQVGLTGVRINTDVSVCHVSGDLSLFENDATYGNGFRGCIAFELGVGLKVKGSVGGIFGKTRGSDADSYSYFSVDGYIGGLNVMLGQYLAISGFTGGLSHKMTLRTNNDNVPAVDVVVNRLTNTGGCATTTPLNRFPLVPNPITTQIMFGVMFKDVVAAGTAFNGGMGMGAEINHNSGLSFLAVGGFMDFVKPPTEQFALGADNSMMLRAKLGLKYDFVDNKLAGTSTLYLNIGNVLKGAAEGDEPYRAGKMALYIARDDWYIFIGNPWKPNNLGDPGGLLASMPRYAEVSLTLPGIGELGRAGAYFAMGTYGINGLPPLPPNSKIEIPGGIRRELENDRGSANPALSHGGVAFGGWLYAGYETPWVYGFQAGIDVGAGFDVALLRYTRAATCPGMGGRFGINDFYGTGRAFAYANGFLQYDDDGQAKDIFSIDAGFMAEFGGPNPTWVKGKLKVKNATIQAAVYGFNTALGVLMDAALDDEDDDDRPAYTTVDIDLGSVCEPAGVEDNRSVGTEPIISQLIPADSMEALQPITVRLNRATGAWFDWYNPARNRTIKRRWAFSVALLKRANGTLIPLGRTERANNTGFVFTPQPTDASQMPTPGERLSFTVRYVV